MRHLFAARVAISCAGTTAGGRGAAPPAEATTRDRYRKIAVSIAGVDPRTARSIAAYDAAAADYQEHWRHHRPRDAVRKFGALAGRGARVIDVACGPALDVRLLQDQGLVVFAGDRGAETIKIAKTLYPKHPVARWDYRQLPFTDARFDGVWAAAALQHLPRTEIVAALAEFRRVQRAGPIFASFREGQGDLDPVEEPPVGTVYATSVTADELKALLLDAGYGEIEIETRPDLLDRGGVTWLYGWGRLPA